MLSVYPRVCGGTRRVESLDFSTDGLSPRVRGNQNALATISLPIGSIPACAGEPGAAYTAVRCAAVYPRVCGGTVSEEGR